MNTAVQIPVSRPTFAEIVVMMTKLGMSDALCDDGRICIGDTHFVASDGSLPTPGRAARIAAQIADAAGGPVCGDAIYDDGEVCLIARCKDDGCHLMRRNIHDSTCQSIKIPYKALMAVAGDLIECLGRPRST